jgi:hypothetical protein
MVLIMAAFFAGRAGRDGAGETRTTAAPQDAEAITTVSSALSRFNGASLRVINAYAQCEGDALCPLPDPAFDTMRRAVDEMEAAAAMIESEPYATLVNRLVVVVERERASVVDLATAVNSYFLPDRQRRADERQALRDIQQAAADRARLAEDLLNAIS